MCIFHKWNKWESYTTESLSYFYGIPCKSDEVRQTRNCQKCGKVQDEHIVTKKLTVISKSLRETKPDAVKAADSAKLKLETVAKTD